MKKMEYVKTNFAYLDGVDSVAGTLEGYSNIPFWNHDLSFRAIKCLLNTIDEKNYYDREELSKHLEEVQELLDSFYDDL